jgi:hypothetical protein
MHHKHIQDQHIQDQHIQDKRMQDKHIQEEMYTPVCQFKREIVKSGYNG